MRARRIIIADQSQVFREGLRKVLLKSGNAVVVGEVSNGADLFTTLSESKVDLLFIDNRFSGENASGLIARIHQRMPSLEIYVISAYDHHRYVEQVRRSGAMGFLSKNVNNQEYLSRILKKEIKSFIHPESLPDDPHILYTSIIHQTKNPLK